MKINQKMAYNLLVSANENSKELEVGDTKIEQKIRNVICGSHLTYRYILLTGLLAKSVNIHANSLTLQSGSDLRGAYDARSLCHDIIIKSNFEKDYLENKIGGSNQPFLSKPARYKELSLDNPVRGKENKEILSDTIDALKGIKTSIEAFERLTTAIYYTHTRKSSKDLTLSTENVSANSIKEVLRQPHNGITLTILSLMGIYCMFGDKFKIVTGNVYQSGSSSNEILDIDLYKKSKAVKSIEVKDKTASSSDIYHAIKKSTENNVTNLLFIGKDFDFTKDEEESIYRHCNDQNINISILTSLKFLDQILFMYDIDEIKENLIKAVKDVDPPIEVFDSIQNIIDDN